MVRFSQECRKRKVDTREKPPQLAGIHKGAEAVAG